MRCEMAPLKRICDAIKLWLKARKKDPHRRILLVDNGFEVYEPMASTPAQIVRWANVTRIEAWKWDVFCYDLICISFESGEDVCTIVEDEPGYKEACSKMMERFPEIPEWFWVVAVPPFAPTVTQLWPDFVPPKPEVVSKSWTQGLRDKFPWRKPTSS